MKRTCSIPACDKSAYGRGWCKAHYQRWLTTGDPGDSPVRRRIPGDTCAIDGCSEPHNSRGWCKRHYRRWLRTGDAGGLEFIAYPLPPEALTYRAIHLRLAAQRGLAADRLCSCGAPARHWAYQHNDPDPMCGDEGLLYSADILNCYAAMCVPCHSALDRLHGQEVLVMSADDGTLW